MKKLYIAFLFALLAAGCYAQNEFTLSEQLFSRLNINPASTGNSQNINLFNTNRLQWAGFEGAPTTTLLNVHSYLKNITSGIGGSFSYDKLGIANSTVNAKLAYSYQVDLSSKALLAFGASAGVYSRSFSPANHIVDPGDIDIPNDTTYTRPDFGFGVELSTPYVMIGGSILHLGQAAATMSTMNNIQSYFAYARGKFPVSNDIMITPSILYMNAGQTNKIEINATAFYQGKYWAGIGYRSLSAMSIMLGMEWEWLRVGYSYELGMGKVFDLNNNTHELMLSVVIPTKTKGKKK